MADDSIIIRSKLELEIDEAERRLQYLSDRWKKAFASKDYRSANILGSAMDKEEAHIEKLRSQLKGTGDEVKAVTGEMTAMERVAGGLATTMAAVFSVKAAKEFVNEMMNVRGQFQQFEVAMETLLGNKDKADKLMKQAIDLAAKTPFYVSDVVGGAKQLLAYGQSAEDVIETLRRLGDIASGVSVPLQRVIGIYGRIMAQGKLTNLTMKQFYSSGIPIVKELQANLGKTSDEIMKMISKGQISFRMVKEAFESMTNEGGKFGNMMEKQSHTITGHINVIKGLVQNMFNEIGKQAEGPIENVLQGIENMVKDYEKWGKVIATVAVTLGILRGAQVAGIAITKLATSSITANSAASIGNAVAMLKNATTTKQATTATKALNKAVMANPYVLLATAVIAATAGIVAYARANDFALQSQKRLDKSIASAAAEATNEESNLARLNATLKTAKKGTDEYNKAKAEAISKYEKYLPNIAEEIDKVGDLSGVYQTLTERIKESVSARAYASYIEKQESESTKKLENEYDNLLGALEKKFGKGSSEAHTKFAEIMAGLLDPEGLSEELQKEIDAMASTWTQTDQYGGTHTYVVNEAQTAISKIIDLRDKTEQFHQKALEAFGVGATKTDLQRALEALNDTDLSGLLAEIQRVKDEVSSLPEGGMRFFSFNGQYYAYKNVGGKATPVKTDGASDQGNMVETLGNTQHDSNVKEEQRKAKELADERRRMAEAQQAEQAKAIRARDTYRKAVKAADKADKDARAKAQKEAIDLMEEGLDKELRQAEHQKAERIRQIEDEKEAYIDRLKELAKARWRASNPDSKAEWDEDTFKLTPEQERAIEEMYGKAGELETNAQKTAQKAIERSLDKQIKEYGDYYSKRAVTAKEWDKKIAEAEKALTRLESEEDRKRLQSSIDSMKKKKAVELAESDYDLVSEYGGATQQASALERLWDARIAAAEPHLKASMERAKKEALAELNVGAFKDMIDWDAVFGDMADRSTASLQRNMEAVRRYLGATKDLTVDQIRDMEEALAQMSDEIASRNPFMAIKLAVADLKKTKADLPDIIATYEKALAEYKLVEEEHRAKSEAIATERAGGVTGERNAELNKEQAEADAELEEAQRNLADSTKELNVAQATISKSSMKVIQAVNNMRGAFASAGGQVAELVGVFDDDAADVIGDAIGLFTDLGDVVSEITEKLAREGEEVVQGLQDTVKGTADAVEGTATAASAAISAVEAASVILLVIKAVIIALTAVFRILKANDEAERRAAEAAREYAQALREIDDASRLANLSNIFGENTLAQFREAKKVISDVGKSIKQTVSDAQDKAMWMLPDSWKAQIKSLAGEFGYTFTADLRSGWQKFWGTGSKNMVSADLQDFVDESGNILTDKLKAWYSEYGDYLGDADKALVDELISQGERYQQAMDDIGSYLQGLFGDTADSIADAMMDAFAQTGDAAADLEDLMNDTAKRIAKSWVVDKLMANVFSKEAEQRMSDMIAANNISGAVNFYNDLIEKANESAPAINEFLKGLNVDWNPDDRTAQGKNTLGASQDSVDESNARLTVIQGHTFLLWQDVSAIRAQYGMLTAQSAALLEHVQGIHINTNQMATLLSDMKGIATTIKNGVATINDRGVKMQ